MFGYVDSTYGGPCQALSVKSHADRHLLVSHVHFLIRHVDAVLVGLGYGPNLVRQTLDRLHTRRYLVGSHLQELGAVLDVAVH